MTSTRFYQWFQLTFPSYFSLTSPSSNLLFQFPICRTTEHPKAVLSTSLTKRLLSILQRTLRVNIVLNTIPAGTHRHKRYLALLEMTARVLSRVLQSSIFSLAAYRSPLEPGAQPQGLRYLKFSDKLVLANRNGRLSPTKSNNLPI